MSKIKKTYKERTRALIKREKLSIIPAPNRILIKITQKQIEDLISKIITRDDGTTCRLFFEPIHFDEGFERKFQQNVSIAEVLGVGDDVRGVQVGDTVILDYLVQNVSDDFVGVFNKDQVISIIAHTTYHQDSATLINGRRAWKKGDYDHLSRILGVLRDDRLIPFDPYVFIEYRSDIMKILNVSGGAMRNNETVIERKVIAAPEGCLYRGGDKVFLGKDDWFDREIAGQKIAVCFKADIFCKRS